MFKSIGNLFKSKKTEKTPEEGNSNNTGLSEQDTYDKTNTNSLISVPEDLETGEFRIFDDNAFSKFYEEKLKNWMYLNI
jgi:hypothetical protein